MCSCIQFAWALVLRSCSHWPNLVGAVDVLEEDECILDLAVDGCVFGFLRNCVVRASTFHQEVGLFQKDQVLRNSVNLEWMTWLDQLLCVQVEGKPLKTQFFYNSGRAVLRTIENAVVKKYMKFWPCVNVCCANSESCH